MGEAHVLEQLRHPLEAAAALAVVHALGDERVEAEVLRLLAGCDRHQGAADGLRVARHERRGAVTGELGRAPPLEQRELNREQREAGEHRQPCRRAEPQQDQQRGLIEDVVGVDVRGLVCEDDAAAVVVEDPHELRVEHHDRLVGPDGRRVRQAGTG